MKYRAPYFANNISKFRIFFQFNDGGNHGDYVDSACSHLAARVDVGQTVSYVANTEVELGLARVWNCDTSYM